jgi:hypothetical protein
MGERSFETNQLGLAAEVGASLETRVAFLAMQHWTNEIVQPSADLKVVAEHMRQVFAREPKVANEENKKTLQRLDLTVSGRYEGPDVDEALIDKFCDLTQDGSRLESQDSTQKHAFDPLLAVVYRGFEAVPALLRHMGDERLTRAVHSGFMNAPTMLCTVGDVCWTVLSEYADAGRDALGASREDGKLLEAWWARTSRTSERDYCLHHLSAPAGEFPSQALIFMAEKRHPEVLPIAYRAALNSKQNIQVGPYLQAMERAGLPQDQVVRQAVAATENKNLDAVHAALWTLSRVSPPAFDVAMAKTLRRLGAHAKGETWLSREASFAQQAAVSNSDDVWKALLEATRRADPDLRIELLNHSSYTDWTPERKRRWFAYLLEFVDDTSKPAPARKDPRTGEPRSDNHLQLIGRIVGDTAAQLAAEQLNVQPIPTFKHPPAAWANFRSKVRRALASALAQN